MKWIGQHIWDFISRFRSDVYLEGTESGTIASGGNLGLDSNNKIVKAASGSGDLTITNAADNRIVTSTGGTGLNAESELTYNGSTRSLSLTGASTSSLFLTQTADTASDNHIEFYNSKGGNEGDDSDDCGTLIFYGNNNAGTPEKTMYGAIRTTIHERDDSDEAGIMRLSVATSNGSTSNIQQALTATGNASGNVVNVDLGYGDNSLTTVAGWLSQTILPQISFTTYAQSLTPTSDWTSGSKDGTAFHTSFINSRNTASGETNTFTGYKVGVGDSATHVGTIDYTGVDISVDFANTNGTQKAKGISTIITDGDTDDMYGLWQQIEDGGKDLYFLSSDATTVDYFSIATGASGATTIKTVDGGGTAANLNFDIDGTVTFDTPTLTITDAIAGTLTVQNTGANSTGGSLYLKNTYNDGDASDSAYCGYIQFWGQDDGDPSETKYGEIKGQMMDVSDGTERGKLIMSVASNGGTRDGLVVDGQSASTNVNIELGYGTSSVTTLAGDLDIDGDNVTAAGALTITPGGTFAVAGGSSEIDLTTSGTVDINAGVLDIDVTGNTALDTARMMITSAGGVEILDTTTSSATEGGSFTLYSNDGAAMGSGHRLGVIYFKGAEDNSGNITTGARIEALTDATWSASENGADLVFYTTDGNASESEVMRCTASTGVSIPTRKFTKTSSTHHEAQGDVVYFGTAGGSYAQGDVCYLNTDGSWVKAQADAENTSSQLLGIALGSDPAVNGMLLRGMITLDHNTGDSNDGRAVYLSEDTAGSVTSTIPADAGDVVRIVGYKMGDDDEIWFCPDNTYILRA